VPDEYVVSGGLYDKWDWSHEQPGADGNEEDKVPVTNVLPDLEVAMTMNPGLHLLVEQGRYDLATPAHAVKYNLDRLRLTPDARKRIHVNYYDAGHMMYLHVESARRFRENVVGFIRETDQL
jgi:carboxypeptidase C (cathepsin A)